MKNEKKIHEICSKSLQGSALSKRFLPKTVEELTQIELEKSFSPTYGSTDSKVQH